MKTLVSLCLFISMAVCLHAQDYMIDFAGTGLSTDVATVEVINLTQGDSLSLFGSDVLHLIPNLGIHTNNAGKSILLIYPNPMKDECKISFYNSNSGNVTMEICDLSGNLIFKSTEQLHQGSHIFSIAGLTTGVYLIIVKTTADIYTDRIVSVCQDIRGIVLKQEGCFKNSEDLDKLKINHSIIEMEYNDGERLLFKGISGNYSCVTTMIPNESETVNFEFMSCTDNDNNNYPVVLIGTQTWMAENLKTTRFNDGSFIPLVTDNGVWCTLTTPGYCWYENDETTYKNTYGALYNWYSVNTGKLCPSGWHVPNDNELVTMMDFLGGQFDAGGKLKETGINHWLSPNNGATNETGFSARPGGARGYIGAFYYMGSDGIWWSASENGSDFVWYQSMSYIYDNAVRGYDYKWVGLSVRCLKE